MMAMTEDCVFENTVPPPDGERYTGQAAVRAYGDRFFAARRFRNRGAVCVWGSWRCASGLSLG